MDTGDYFFPASVALLLSSLALAVAGWKTPIGYRILVIVPGVMLLGILMFTVLWFWPANRALWQVAQGRPGAMQDREQIIALVNQWVAFDWLRIGAATLGYVCSIRALSIPFPAVEHHQMDDLQP